MPVHRRCGARDVAVAGVGINLAIQDAVAAANILATPLKDNRVSGMICARCRTPRMGRCA